MFKKIKPEYIFLILGFIYGLVNIIMTPPFEVPDENRHFYRIHQLSEGKMLSIKYDNRLGGYVPQNIEYFSKKFYFLTFKDNSRVIVDSILASKSIAFDKNDKVFVDFPYMANYNFFSYLPQITAYSILKIFRTKPFFIYYLTKLFVLLFWLIITFWTIKIIPAYKWLIAILSLLPMAVYENTSLSADSMTNTVSFLAIAYFLKLIFENKKITKNEIIVTSFFAILLPLVKVVYFPLLFLIVAIPVKNFADLKKSFLFKITLITLTILISVFYSKMVSQQNIPYNNYNKIYRNNQVGGNSDVKKQIEFIKNNPVKTFTILSKSALKNKIPTKSYIGILGWLDTRLPFKYYIFAYIFIFIFALTDSSNILNLKQKTLFFMVFLMIFYFIYLSQYISWFGVGSRDLDFIQGRYFIPIMPLFFFLFSNKKIFLNTNIKNVLLIVFVILSIFVTAQTLKKRYFISDYVKKIDLTCNAENLDTIGNFTTNIIGITLGNGNTKTDKESFSGKFSAKTDASKNFAFTLTIDSVEKNDYLIINVWRKGSKGHIVMDSHEDGFYYTSAKTLKYQNGWELINMTAIINQNLKNKKLNIYIYNPSKQISYFDDFSLQLYKHIIK